MLRHLLLSSSLAVALVAVPALAHAQVETSAVDTQETNEPAPSTATAPAKTAQPAAQTESYWYGWQTLTSDAASISAVGTGIKFETAPLAYLGVAGYYLGAPIVHIAHGRVGVAFASLGLRLGLPSLGGAIGFATAGPCTESERRGFFGCAFHGWNEAAIGGLIGLGAAIAIDSALLAHGKRPVDPPRESGMPRLTSVAPSYDPATRAAAVGVGGTF
jgi:hypothetical protein